MRKGCKHPNVIIREFGVSYAEHMFEDGRVAGHHGGVGDLTGRCEAECGDCGLERSFRRSSKSLPRWLRGRLEQLDGEAMN